MTGTYLEATVIKNVPSMTASSVSKIAFSAHTWPIICFMLTPVTASTEPVTTNTMPRTAAMVQARVSTAWLCSNRTGSEVGVMACRRNRAGSAACKAFCVAGAALATALVTAWPSLVFTSVARPFSSMGEMTVWYRTVKMTKNTNTCSRMLRANVAPEGGDGCAPAAVKMALTDPMPSAAAVCRQLFICGCRSSNLAQVVVASMAWVVVVVYARHFFYLHYLVKRGMEDLSTTLATVRAMKRYHDLKRYFEDKCPFDHSTWRFNFSIDVFGVAVATFIEGNVCAAVALFTKIGFACFDQWQIVALLVLDGRRHGRPVDTRFIDVLTAMKTTAFVEKHVSYLTTHYRAPRPWAAGDVREAKLPTPWITVLHSLKELAYDNGENENIVATCCLHLPLTPLTYSADCHSLLCTYRMAEDFPNSYRKFKTAWKRVSRPDCGNNRQGCAIVQIEQDSNYMDIDKIVWLPLVVNDINCGAFVRTASGFVSFVATGNAIWRVTETCAETYLVMASDIQQMVCIDAETMAVVCGNVMYAMTTQTVHPVERASVRLLAPDVRTKKCFLTCFAAGGTVGVMFAANTREGPVVRLVHDFLASEPRIEDPRLVMSVRIRTAFEHYVVVTNVVNDYTSDVYGVDDVVDVLSKERALEVFRKVWLKDLDDAVMLGAATRQNSITFATFRDQNFDPQAAGGGDSHTLPCMTFVPHEDVNAHLELHTVAMAPPNMRETFMATALRAGDAPAVVGRRQQAVDKEQQRKRLEHLSKLSSLTEDS